ncbi:MAG: hypothetical protein GY862_32480 [Gammaproteobacteria bacterium]|nr:hypothetical protein [Gammaproteobacteria bacterium]
MSNFLNARIAIISVKEGDNTEGSLVWTRQMTDGRFAFFDASRNIDGVIPPIEGSATIPHHILRHVENNLYSPAATPAEKMSVRELIAASTQGDH